MTPVMLFTCNKLFLSYYEYVCKLSLDITKYLQTEVNYMKIVDNNRFVYCIHYQLYRME
jgi:hypothetical protein